MWISLIFSSPQLTLEPKHNHENLFDKVHKNTQTYSLFKNIEITSLTLEIKLSHKIKLCTSLISKESQELLCKELLSKCLLFFK